MHILFLPSWYPSSPDDPSGSFFREQAHALNDIGVKVGVIALALRPVTQSVSAWRDVGRIRIENDDGIPTYRVDLINFTPRVWPVIMHRFGKAALRLFDQYIKREGRPDVLHVHAALPAGGAGLEIAVHHSIPYVLSEHSTALARGRVNFLGLRQMQTAFRAAYASYAVSSPFASLLEGKLGLDVGMVRVMPNSVNDVFLEGTIERSQGSIFRFCHISLLDKKKNVEGLIRAFASNFRDQELVSLIIGGDAPSLPALRKLARDCGVFEKIEFTGRLSRNQVRDVLARSDAFVLPSHFETFGVVLIEAAAMGVPIVATRCGGPEDIVTGNNGILVPVGDNQALADAMKKMYQTRGTWDAQRIRDECRQKFCAVTLAGKWREIYSACVQ